MKNCDIELIETGGEKKMCCCPFHDDKTPSFSIDDGRGLFHCFGCGASGNVINFLMKFQEISFPEAVKKIAEIGQIELEKAGIDLQLLNEENVKKGEILHALDLSAKFYVKVLANETDAGSARQYLSGKKILPATAKKYKLGYSPTQNSLLKHLSENSISEETMEMSGMIYKKRFNKGSDRDRFMGRLMIPISDINNNAVAFGARVLTNRNSPENKAKFKQPKYLNSPESLVFKKSAILYGIDVAAEGIKRENMAVIVEGYFDVISLHQAGIDFSVGCLGLSLSNSHIKQASKHGKKIVLCFDGDAPGQHAMEKLCQDGMLEEFSSSEIEIKIADISVFGEGVKDPSDFVNEMGKDAAEVFRNEVIGKAKPWMTWYTERILNSYEYKTDHSQFEACVGKIVRFLKLLKSPAAKSFQAYKFAAALGGDSLSLRTRLESDLLKAADCKMNENSSGHFESEPAQMIKKESSLGRVNENGMRTLKSYSNLPPRPKLYNSEENTKEASGFKQFPLKFKRGKQQQALWKPIDFSNHQISGNVKTQNDAEVVILNRIVSNRENRKDFIDLVEQSEMRGKFSDHLRQSLFDSVRKISEEKSGSDVDGCIQEFVKTNALAGILSDDSLNKSIASNNGSLGNENDEERTIIKGFSNEFAVQDSILLISKARMMEKVEMMINDLSSLASKLEGIGKFKEEKEALSLANQIKEDQSKVNISLIEALEKLQEIDERRESLRRHMDSIYLEMRQEREKLPEIPNLNDYGGDMDHVFKDDSVESKLNSFADANKNAVYHNN